jgi:hypothetical protein
MADGFDPLPGHGLSSLHQFAIENGPFIDGLPIKHGGFFHSYVTVCQRVHSGLKNMHCL